MQQGKWGAQTTQAQHALSAMPIKGFQNLEHHMTDQAANLAPSLVTWKMGIPEGTGLFPGELGGEGVMGKEGQEKGKEGGEGEDRGQEEVH